MSNLRPLMVCPLQDKDMGHIVGAEVPDRDAVFFLPWTHMGKTVDTLPIKKVHSEHEHSCSINQSRIFKYILDNVLSLSE